MDIDDSYFESEEQACDGSESKKPKEKESYSARRCELGVSTLIKTYNYVSDRQLCVQWFLEESFPGSFANCERPKEQPRVGGGDFMLLKYRADLCYSLKEFSSAAGLFEQVLELLPPLNAMVKREVVDSLARCYSHLGQHQLALERAKQMV